MTIMTEVHDINAEMILKRNNRSDKEGKP